jgi:hypothetical protein
MVNEGTLLLFRNMWKYEKIIGIANFYQLNQSENTLRAIPNFWSLKTSKNSTWAARISPHRIGNRVRVFHRQNSGALVREDERGSGLIPDDETD